jgi:Kef-type K+ transport system membrane component KefB
VAAVLGGGSALTSHVAKTGMRLGVNASPEPVSNIVASLLEDLGVAALVAYAVFHPVQAAIIAGVLLVTGLTLLLLLAARIPRGLCRRRDARARRRSSDTSVADQPTR